MIFLPVLSSYFWITPKLPELIIDTGLCLKKQTSKKKQQQQKAFWAGLNPIPKNLTTLWTLQSVPRRYIAQTHTQEPIDRAPEIVEVTNQILWWRLSSSSWLESKKIWNNLCERKNQYISVRKSKRVVWECIKTTGRTVSSHLNSKRCKRKNCSNCYWNRGSSIYMHSAL